MMITHLEILVEEPSAEAALQSLLPRHLGEVTFAIYRHAGKADLLRKLPGRLAGYANWLPANWRIVVLLDRDDDDCIEAKRRLDAIAVASGLKPKGRKSIINRIAIEELEAWFFGDWQAVRAAYPGVSATIPSQSRYRDPDAISGGTWEAFERVLQSAGYMNGGLRKIEAARAIGAHMDPRRNISPSFQSFWSAVFS
jgi:hypothetical protein